MPPGEGGPQSVVVRLSADRQRLEVVDEDVFGRPYDAIPPLPIAEVKKEAPLPPSPGSF